MVRRLALLSLCFASSPALARPKPPERVHYDDPNPDLSAHPARGSLPDLSYQHLPASQNLNETTLFGHDGPLRPEDALQGRDGNCHFHGSVAAIAAAAPGFLEQLFERDGSGNLHVEQPAQGEPRVYVRLHERLVDASEYEKAPSGVLKTSQLRPKLYPATSELAMTDPKFGPVFAGTRPAEQREAPRKLAVALLEKAWWRKRGTPSMDLGWGHKVLEELTGLPAKLRRLDGEDLTVAAAARLGQELRAALSEHRAVVAWSNFKPEAETGGPKLSISLREAQQTGLVANHFRVSVTEGGAGTAFEPNIVFKHNYALVGVADKLVDGVQKTFVKLYNPNGRFDELPIEHFLVLFGGLGISSPLR